ncbi:MAG: nucleotidyltransferase family protein [Clostridia bacterium]|nr:nucleotidyltransferase family protein [Clostridia bacterium]
MMSEQKQPDISAKLRHAFSLSCCREIAQLLEGIEFLFYKGPVHAEELYAEPWLRQSGDIDILVRPKDVNSVLRRLGAAGYTYLGGKPIGEDDFCTNYQTGHPDMTLWHSHAGELEDGTGRRMSVEVHVSPFKISNRIPYSLHRRTSEALFARRRFADVRGEAFPMPGRTDELVALIHHFAKHAAQLMTVFNCSFYRGGGLPLQYLAEIATYIRRYGQEIDAEIAEDLIESHGMAEEFRFAGRLLQSLHGLSFPFSLPERGSDDGWERIYAALNRLEPEELLSPEVYSRLEKLLSSRSPHPLYRAAEAGTDPVWVAVDEMYKFGGDRPRVGLPLYSFSWCALREEAGLRVLARIPQWQIGEDENLSLRVQLGGEGCTGCRDCLKNYALTLRKNADGVQGELKRMVKKVVVRSESAPTADPVDVRISGTEDFVEADLLFRGEHRARLPFNIGLSLSLSRDGTDCDSDTVLMWSQGVSFPFSCLLLGEIQ